jgi:hypothetical protein
MSMRSIDTHDDGLDSLVWTKASLSVGDGACVEVARLSAGFAVRHSKDRGIAIRFSDPEWRAFLAGVKRGEFDDLR